MQINHRVKKAIYAAIDEINFLLPEDQRLESSLSMPLVGRNGKLDSLGVVNFVVAAEQKIQAEFNKTISLTGMISSRNLDRCETVGALCEFLTKLLQDKGYET